MNVVLTFYILLIVPLVVSGTMLQGTVGSIEGSVVRITSGEPIAGAQVRLVLVPEQTRSVPGDLTFGRLETESVSTRAVTTDSRGRFSFPDVPPNSYRLRVTARGYVTKTYPQEDPISPATVINSRQDKTIKDIVIQMTPAGIVGGRVLDDLNSPAVGVNVVLLASVFGPQGRTSQVVSRATTDDRGDYRFYDIVPGRYYIGVGETSSIEDRTSGLSSGTARFRFQFYPGVDEFSQAVPIEVRSSLESTIPLVARRSGTYRIAGSVIDTSTNKPPLKANIILMEERRGIPVRNYDPKTGRFTVESVLPGTYILQAQFQGGDSAAMAAGGEVAWALFPTARTSVTVTDRDIDGVTLLLRTPDAISGRVHIEGEAVTPLQGRIHLRPIDSEGRMSPVAAINRDGSFQIAGVMEGRYTVNLQQYPSGLYVKRIEFGGVDVLSRPFHFLGGAGGTIEVVLRQGAAQLGGIVMDSRLRPVLGAHVVIVPEQRLRADLYKYGISEANGGFTVPELAPGEYRVFAWPTLAHEHFDPEFIQRFEQHGKRISISESSNINVELRIISSP